MVQAFDAYEFERMAVPEAAGSDFVLVNLARDPVGAPVRPDAVNALIAAAGRRAGLARAVSPHQLRHAFGSNVADAGGTIDEIQDLLGHMSMSSSQVYLHPDPARLRAAVDRVPSPRELAGMRAVTAPAAAAAWPCRAAWPRGWRPEILRICSPTRHVPAAWGRRRGGWRACSMRDSSPGRAGIRCG